MFVTVRDYAAYLWSKKLAILVAGLVGAAIAVALETRVEEEYTAELTFLINEESTGGSAVGGLLGQFGFSTAGSEFNYDKIIALSKSQKLGFAVLLDSLRAGAPPERVGEAVVRAERLDEEWALGGTWPGLGASHVDSLELDARQILRSLHYFTFVEPGICRTSADNATGLLTLSTQSPDEGLALALTRNLYDRLSGFYTEESVSARRASVSKLREKADSLRGALERAEYRAARLSDTRLGVAQQRDLIERTRLQREISLLGLAYAEVVKNLETAQFALSTKTPFFQVVDEPFAPLPRSRQKFAQRGAVGFAIGLVFGGLLAAGARFYASVMNPNHV